MNITKIANRIANLHYPDIPKTRGDKMFRRQRVIELQKLVESELKNYSMPDVDDSLVSDDAIKYLKEVKKKFKGKISRAWSEQDYLTAPNDDSEYKQGMRECLDLKLIKRADDGSEFSYIRYEITERGYEVLKLAK